MGIFESCLLPGGGRVSGLDLFHWSILSCLSFNVMLVTTLVLVLLVDSK